MPLSAKQREIVHSALKRIAAGESMASIGRDKAMAPATTIYDWIEELPDGGERYARAREQQGQHHADLVLVKALDESIEPNSRRIMVDALKWTASKLYPARYGDKLALGGAADLPPIRQEVSEKADAFTDTLAGLARRADAEKATRH